MKISSTNVNGFKYSVLSKAVVTVMAVGALAGCNNYSSSDTPTTPVKPTEPTELYKAADNEVVVYYKRDAEVAATGLAATAGLDDYEGWGMHLWNNDNCKSLDFDAMGMSGETTWDAPRPADGFSETYGAYYILKIDQDANDPNQCINFILHKGNDKAFGNDDLKIDLTQLGESRGLFGFDGSTELSYTPIADRPISIDGQQAHWLDADTIGWDAIKGAAKVELRYDIDAGIKYDEESKKMVGGTVVELTDGNLTDEIKAKYPHLKESAAGTISLNPSILKFALKSQIVMVAYNAAGNITAATEIQKPGVIDDLFVNEDAGNAISEELGAVVTGNDAEFKLWAPTAQEVKLFIYDADKKEEASVTMTENSANGIWSASQSGVVGKFYRYQVTVYHPATHKIETVMVTDPYSLSLSSNSLYSQVVDLANDAALKPADWDTYAAPSLDKDIDQVLYESHLRDFSFSDTKGTADLNGKYLALTEDARESVTHLKALKDAGMTTLHILPAFDIATVDEVNNVDINDTVKDLCDKKADAAVCSDAAVDKSTVIDDLLASYKPESEDAQALMNDLRMLDSFNWGYDPFHYTVPEGSYATNPEGSLRIKEFRQMVKSVHDMGLKVIMDVVYNHTNASGTNDKSVLDKIVPGYYHRLNPVTGGVENSTCCDNTATENPMMGKLMIDSLKVWTSQYHVDGYRFDLMGHQPKDLMVDALAEIKKLDDDTYFYGEGWNFGEVQNDARFTQATQVNMAGTGIGTFSDRLRDAVRGGSPFDGADNGLRGNQGFGNMAYTNEDSPANAKDAAMHNQDLIRLGMAGNLAEYVLIDKDGNTKLGKNVDYNGQAAGYTKSPAENVSYVSKHDNQTLWDINAYKIAKGTSSADRARMQSVGLSTVMLGQGVPFIHMGSELLRSKSMQRDSYDSGDWYNRVRFDGSNNNWNVGLPRKDKDGSNYDLIRTIIADSTAKPAVEDIALTKAQFLELLKIRNESELFRLATEDDIKKRIDFHNVGKDQTQGLIVMSIDDGAAGGADLDKTKEAIVVIINASSESKDVVIDAASGFELHAIQQASADDIVKTASFTEGTHTFTVPAITAAVFVKPQADADTQGAGLPVDASSKDMSKIPPYGETAVYVKGSMNGWGAKDEWKMTFVNNGTYEVTHALTAGAYEFKFADADWKNPNFGCNQVTVDAGSLDLGTEGNCKVTIPADGDYKFTFDAGYAVALNKDDKPTVSVVAAK